MPEAVLAFGFLLVGVGVMLGLYLVISAETSNPTVLDREAAEREAKVRGGHAEETDPDRPDR
ncbi:hypothetical protein [Natrononativus amylolyticus]|uniref:hypothetical protein n=1 Tax=Natrononativus amylolyticus TaxID=2963434 RepID=UPI0020CF8FEC|nr:hypothetical protein [Natrononativus amylolyticus]